MSLEQALAANTAAILALTAHLAGVSSPAVPQPAPAPQQPAPAPQQPSGYPPAGSPSLQYQPIAPPVAQATIPTPPPMPQYQAPVQQAYPFHDNVTAATWAKDVWGKAAAINQDAAMQKFGALMQGLGAADFDSLTPAHYPALFAGIQQIKAEMGIPG